MLPWRNNKKTLKNPYFIWISEVMLQQTTVKAVIPRFNSFIKRWPDIEKLSKASIDDVLHEWQGLGYYSRAHNIHKTAKIICNDLSGKFPESLVSLKSLPGIGEYTAGAIASIAFSKPVLPIDVNIERVLARINGISLSEKKSRVKIRIVGSLFIELNRPGDLTQALMDLGATICRFNNPLCIECPISKMCYSYEKGITDKIPGKKIKKHKKIKHGVVFFVINKKGEFLSRKRSSQNLFRGMMELPMTPLSEKTWDLSSLNEYYPLKSRWLDTQLTVKHPLSGFIINLKIYFARTASNKKGDWINLDKIEEYAFPTLFKQVINVVVKNYLTN